MILLLADCHLYVLPTIYQDNVVQAPFCIDPTFTYSLYCMRLSLSICCLWHKLAYDTRSFTRRNVCCPTMLLEVTARRIDTDDKAVHALRTDASNVAMSTELQQMVSCATQPCHFALGTCHGTFQVQQIWT